MKGENICFKLFREKKNWHEAYETCSRSSSYLANEKFHEIGKICNTITVGSMPYKHKLFSISACLGPVSI